MEYFAAGFGTLLNNDLNYSPALQINDCFSRSDYDTIITYFVSTSNIKYRSLNEHILIL